MTVERELVGLALPFAAGTAAAIYAGVSSASTAPLFIMLCTAIPLTLLMHPGRRRLTDRAIWLAIMLTALGTGALGGLMSNETYRETGFMLEMTGQYGEYLAEAAEDIPFRDSRTNAFVKAILTGERNGMSEDVTSAFRDSGASHILALSGLHLGIIYLMISRILSIIGYSMTASRVRSLTTVLFCGFYTLATGAGPSAVRALLFIIINEISKATGRYRSTGNTLLVAMMIQLCISPSAIRSVGFQLSYAAMAGIAFIYPSLKGIWPDDRNNGIGMAVTKPGRYIWNSASMSIACQLTTGPLAYLYFGTLPKYFLLTNLIALPLTGVIIPAAALTLLLHQAGICPDLLMSTTEWLISMLIGALEIISSM